MGHADPQTLVTEIPVVEVTLLEDRAVVQRRGPVRLPPGRARVTIEGVAPVLADKTLAAALTSLHDEASAGLRARDVSVKRWRAVEDAERPEHVAETNEKIRETEQLREARAQNLAQIEAEAASLATMVELTMQEVAQDVAWGREELRDVDGELDDLEAKIAALGLQACALLQELRTTERELEDLRALAASHAGHDADARASITVELVNPTEEVHEVELAVDYVVPGALWRPCHTARLVEDDGGTRVHLQTEGCVWQATGEDWNEVQLVFSTERPSLGVSPPMLTTDRLRARKRGSQVDVMAREQTVHTAGLGQDEEISEASDDLPGIDDGGIALALRSRTRATVVGDGRPHRVPIARAESEAKATLLCVPELAPSVMLRTEQANTSQHPLLAGPVDLVRGSGLVGRTSILYVAPGERFELGWGPDRSLRVQRELEFLDESRRALSSWRRKPRRVKVRLSNLGSRPATIEVKERIATSEVEKVEVELDSASHNATPDAEGFVTWTTRLRGFGREALELQWTLVVHDDVSGL
ncbi:MAG: mucoidy inhibitor MuiA family protein [Myxococcota bacterium]